MLRRNVLIFHAGGLGDFVLTWPLGIALGRLHPTSRIIYVTHPSKGALAAAAIGLDWRSIEAGWAALYSEGTSLDEKCAQTIQGAHAIYTFMATEGDVWCRNVGRLSPESKVVALSMIPVENHSGHISSQLVDQLSAVPAVRGAVEQILISISKTGLGRPHRVGRPIIIHPGSGGRDKCWPVDSFIRLIDRLSASGRQVKVIVGEVELERFSEGQMKQLESSAAVAKPAAYVDLMYELGNSAGFIGHDSGPGHLAGVMGLPALILFGPTDPAVWRPLGPKVRTLRNLNLADLTVDEVYSAADQL